jgi:hypothetical protein
MLALQGRRAVIVHEEDLHGIDTGEIRAGLRDDCIESPLGLLDDTSSALPGLLGAGGTRLEHEDLPAGELEWLRVDAGEAELQHATGPVPEQLEDLRGGSGGKRGRQAAHRYARYMNEKRTGKFLGMPYDWRRPTVARLRSRWWNDDDRRVFTPKTYGWGFDINVAQVLRRLRLRG